MDATDIISLEWSQPAPQSSGIGQWYWVIRSLLKMLWASRVSSEVNNEVEENGAES